MFAEHVTRGRRWPELFRLLSFGRFSDGVRRQEKKNLDQLDFSNGCKIRDGPVPWYLLLRWPVADGPTAPHGPTADSLEYT
jgi:hypothetical protein